MIRSSVPDLNRLFGELGLVSRPVGLVLVTGQSATGKTALVQDLVYHALLQDIPTRVACVSPKEWEALGLYPPTDSERPRGITHLNSRNVAQQGPPLFILDDVRFGRDVGTVSRDHLVFATAILKKESPIDYFRQADQALCLDRDNDIVTVSVIKNREGPTGALAKFKLGPARALQGADPIRSRWERLLDEEDFF